MSTTIILSDDVHLHKKNFASLFSVLSETPGVQVKFLSAGRDMWNRYGDYSGITLVEDRARSLEVLTKDQLGALSGHAKGVAVNAFAAARSEILSFVLATCPNWYGQSIPNDDDFILTKLYEENPAILRLNLAAVMVWCEIYTREIQKISAISAMIIFSGSQIYQKILISICAASRPRAFVVETFQTGTEFYFEERYSPITKGSDIRLESVFNSLILSDSFPARQNEINKAQNKLLNAQNKNVKQPDSANLPSFLENRPMVLIACQVQNDFSIIESDAEDINPLSNYKKLLDEIISQTEFNILVKTHPWERNKTHLQTSFTKEHLIEFVAQKPLSYVTIVSQSSFEACFYGGLKPYLLGNSFFSGRGFTSEHSSPRALATAMAQNGEEHMLDIAQYSRFLDFCTRLLQLHLASVHKSGMAIIRSRLFPSQPVEVGVAPKTPVQKTIQTQSGAPASSPAASKPPAAPPLPPPAAAAPKPSVPAAAPVKPAPRPITQQAAEDKLIADARTAFNAGNYRQTASCLAQAALISKTPTPRYRAAAEAMEMAGDVAGAIDLLKKAASMAKDSLPIERRIKELGRSAVMRKLLPEKKYMGLVELMKA